MINKILHQWRSTRLGGHLVRSATASVLLKVANAGCVYAIAIILARSLGPDQYGMYSFAFALVMLLMVATKAGFPELLVREVAGYKMDAKWELLRGIVSFSDRVVLALSGIALAILLAVFNLHQDSLEDTARYTYLWAFLLVPILAFATLRGGAIRGFGDVVIGQLPDMLLRTGVFLILLLLVLISGRSLSPQLAMALHASAGLIGLAFGVFHFRKLISSAESSGSKAINAKKWISDALPFTMVTGVLVINSNVDIIMLGWLTGNEEVGIYRVANQTVVVVSFALSAINMVVAPHIARLFRAGDMSGLQKMVTIGGRVSAIAGVPVGVILILWGELFLTVVFGERFVTAALPLSILCAGQIINSLMGINGTVLTMSLYASETAWVLATGALLNILLNLWLIPILGAAGAAVATASSLAYWNVILSWRVYHHLGIKTTAFQR